MIERCGGQGASGTFLESLCPGPPDWTRTRKQVLTLTLRLIQPGLSRSTDQEYLSFSLLLPNWYEHKTCITVFIHALALTAETAGWNEALSPIRPLPGSHLTPCWNSSFLVAGRIVMRCCLYQKYTIFQAGTDADSAMPERSIDSSRKTLPPEAATDFVSYI